MSKYDDMAAEAERLWNLAQECEDPEEAKRYEMMSANLWHDIENDDKD